MPPDAPTIIQEIVAPAVMIPACGLLLLSSSARMNTLLARIRAFHTERLNVWRDETPSGSRGDALRSLRLEGLESQTHKLLGRARILRTTMLQLFASITCNLLSVLGLALDRALEGPESLYYVSVGLFLTGILFFLGAMATSVWEVATMLDTVQYEHGRVEKICASDVPPGCSDMATPPHPETDAGEGTGL